MRGLYTVQGKILVMRRVFLFLAGTTVSLAATAAAQSSPPQAAEPPAQAYYEFMMARRLEADGDMAGALAALERARRLDPESAEVLAEVAALHARHNRGEDALKAATAAVAIEPDNTEANRVIALVYAAWADGMSTPPAGQSAASLRQRAIESLQRIQDSPAMATDLNLQVTYGRLLVRASRPTEAVPVLERVVAQAPYAAEPLALLADARLSLDQPDQAAEALSAAAEIQPRYYVQLGELQERRGLWAEAADAFGNAVANLRTPSRDLRLRWIAALLNVPGGTGAAKAKEAIADIVKANPTDTRALYLLSAASRQLGDFTGAEDAARMILKADPASLQGLSALSQAMLARYDYRQIVELLSPFEREATSRSKGRTNEGAMLLAQLGIAHQQLAQYDRAIAAFIAASNLAERDPEYEAYVVQALIVARKHDRAAVVAADALTRDADHPRLTRYRAQALTGAGRAAEGVKLIEDAAAREPSSRELALGLAETYAEQKRFDDAIRVVQGVQALAETDTELVLRLGALYEEAGRLVDAEREFRKVLAQDPLDANALNYLGYMLAERGERLPESLELIQRALKIEPENPAYHDSLGWAFFKMGRLDEAEPALTRAAAALVGNSVVQDHHGDLLARRGRWTDAVAAWERALAGDNDSIDRAAIEKKIRDGRRRQ
jgi:tetratricopeptide (TPR) repeat protein